MKKTTVLVVDDESGFREELRETLSLSGYETIETADGDEALRLAREQQPDVVVLDLKMAGKSGFQVADEMRSRPETAKIPIIAMTAYYTEKEHTALMKLTGIRTCLQKPFNPLDIITEIESMLKGEKGRL